LQRGIGQYFTEHASRVWQNPPDGGKAMRVGIIGGGTIARLLLEHMRVGDLGTIDIVAIAGRSNVSRGRALATEFGVPFVTDIDALLACKPEVVVEAASHEAVHAYGEKLLRRGVTLIVLSGGALADDALRVTLERVAAQHRALLYVPSGGIGGLDALKAACIAGVEEVTIAVTKPAAAWKGIPYVERLGIDLDRLTGPVVLFDGPARSGVPHFPANVNIAAVLSLAGLGLDRTRLKVVADPALVHNTHFIEVRGKTGNISIKLENVPSADNPKTALLACYSALAALKTIQSSTRYGT
jgi:aspartate dehydrogenase